MAQIVPFRMGAARGAPESEPGPDRRAEIIIFPGVRRERHADPPPMLRHRDEPQPARDLLQLPD